MRCSNINREITKLNSLTTRNSRNSSYIHCRQKSWMLYDNIWKRTCEKNSSENLNRQQNIQFCLFQNQTKVWDSALIIKRSTTLSSRTVIRYRLYRSCRIDFRERSNSRSSTYSTLLIEFELKKKTNKK